MNGIMKYFLTCVTVLLSSPLLFAYTVEFVNTGSSPECFNDPHDISKNVVWIYYARSPQQMDEYFGHLGKTPEFIEGLKLSNKYFQDIAPALQTATGFIPEVGPVISAAVMPTVKIHEFLVSTIPSFFEGLIPGKIEADLRNKYDIERDKNIPKGNTGGFRAIRTMRQSDKTIYMTVVSKENKSFLMYNVPIDAHGKTYFTVAKDPKTGKCFGVLVKQGDPGYYLPSGPALRDRDYLADLLKYLNKDVLPGMALLKHQRLPEIQKEVEQIKAAMAKIK